MKTIKRVLLLLLVFSMVISLVTGCRQQKTQPGNTDPQASQPDIKPTEPPEPEAPEALLPMSFDYTLTEQDEKDALALVKDLETCVEREDNEKIISVGDQLQEKIDYLSHQYLIAEIKYYSDLEDDEAYDNYVTCEDAYLNVREETLRVLKVLYETDLSAKENIFAGWTDAQLRELEFSGEAIALEKERSDLERAYLALEDSASTWSAEVDEIYRKFVNSGRQLAALYGYDNYYDYAANEIYMRKYSETQRTAFRKNVKEKLLPFYLEIDACYWEKASQLTEERKDLRHALRYDPCLETNEYLSGYIGTYPEEMKTTMSHLFDRDAVVYANSANAHGVAYTGYSEYCDQPFVFLGKGVQDLLTVVHELGHYTAYYHFNDAQLPYDTCEVHSQGNEWLFMHYLEGKIDPEVYEVFLLQRLRMGLQLVIMSTLVDEYEERVYKSGEVSSPEVFETIMSGVLDDYPGIEAFSTRKSIYSYAQHVQIETPVYYLSYATSELASMLFFTMAEEESYAAAQEIYTDLCLKTPVNQVFFDTLADVGLPDPFAVDTVEKIIGAFGRFLKEDVLQPAA